MNHGMDDDPNIMSLQRVGYLGDEPREELELLGETRERPNVEHDLPCVKYMAGLLQELKDLVSAISKSWATPSPTQDPSKLRRAKRLKKSARITPRLIRLRDAPDYVGMDPNRFNAEARPYLTEIPIGKQGVAFDKIDLDTWVEQYKDRNGRPGKAMKGGELWGKKSHQD
ncbi:MAG: hypothetical protein ACLQPD_35425, partial [Desulfomonilaceae bacterium]